MKPQLWHILLLEVWHMLLAERWRHWQGRPFVLPPSPSPKKRREEKNCSLKLSAIFRFESGRVGETPPKSSGFWSLFLASPPDQYWRRQRYLGGASPKHFEMKLPHGSQSSLIPTSSASCHLTVAGRTDIPGRLPIANTSAILVG